jgi:hypothetical protein
MLGIVTLSRQWLARKMMYKEGDKLFYVDGSGNITNVIAAADERHGCVSITGENGRPIGEIGTFHLFSTSRGAEIASKLRKPGDLVDCINCR